jgi:hypothetical protein
MTTILTATGQIEIPELFRKEDALHAGQRCDIQRMGRGEYHVRVEEPSGDDGDWVDVLLSCPEKGWFEPIERTETTDDLRTIRFE